MLEAPDAVALVLAAASRGLALGLMALADALLPDHASDAAVFQTTCEAARTCCLVPGCCVRLRDPLCPGSGGAAPAASTRLARIVAWDAHWFLRIAQCGYQSQQAHAFFPLLPGARRVRSCSPMVCAFWRQAARRHDAPARGLSRCAERLRTVTPAITARQRQGAGRDPQALAHTGFALSNACFSVAAVLLSRLPPEHAWSLHVGPIARPQPAWRAG